MTSSNGRLASERQDMILAAVRAEGTVRLTDLVRQLGVTAVTVRRDVGALVDRGLVARVHGGVTLARFAETPEPAESGLQSTVGALAPRALIGMVTPSVEYYWPQIIQGAQSAVSAAGGQLLLRASSYDPDEDRRQVSQLLARGAQAVLIGPSVEGDAGSDLLRWLAALEVPVVLVERLPPTELTPLALDAAVTAHAVGAGLALRHLADLGHRHLGLVVSGTSPTIPAIRSGAAATIAELGFPEPAAYEVPAYGSPGWASAYDRILRRCLDSGVTGLLVHPDREAIGIAERARDLDIPVPEQLAIVSYDDEVAAASDPPLTAIRPPKDQLGALAAQLTLARLADPSERPVHRVELWPRLVVRESTGQHPTTNPVHAPASATTPVPAAGA